MRSIKTWLYISVPKGLTLGPLFFISCNKNLLKWFLQMEALQCMHILTVTNWENYKIMAQHTEENKLIISIILSVAF